LAAGFLPELAVDEGKKPANLTDSEIRTLIGYMKALK